MTKKRQKLYSDVMKYEGHMFLITVCDPLHLVLSTPIERETANQLGLALQGQLDVLRSRSFVPTIVYTDPGAGFQTLVNHFPGMIIDTRGVKDNNAKVDIKIRRVKELCRSVQASLPWAVPKTMVKDLVAYAMGCSHDQLIQTAAKTRFLTPTPACNHANPTHRWDGRLGVRGLPTLPTYPRRQCSTLRTTTVLQYGTIKKYYLFSCLF